MLCCVSSLLLMGIILELVICDLASGRLISTREFFSFDDMPPGQTDPNLSRFSLGPDQTDLIPVLKEIIAIFPAIKLLGSPWSPPAWMKDNDGTIGGSLKQEYYQVYALYLTKYIQGMKAAGIHIDAITPQNEPLNPNNNPSMVMQANQEALFIKQYLGPTFKAHGITTKIIIYDHNCDKPDYPISILNDPDARQYVDGSAFHMYAGNIDALTTVHNAYPNKNVYFTEQWIGAPPNWRTDIMWHVQTLIIGASRNWARTVLEWNLAADQNERPHTPGGCTRCLGAITIDGDNVSRNPGYYNVAVAAKFARPGAVRIDSTYTGTLPSVAFQGTDKTHELVVLNTSGNQQRFSIFFNGMYASCSLPAYSVGTYVW